MRTTSGRLIYFLGVFIMPELKEHQPSMTIDEQIANLRSKGLIIEDEEKAASFLNDVSYFRLIKAYSLCLKNRNGDYNKDVNFEDIMELYLFNSNFRQALFAQIEKVEVNLRCRLSNYFCNKYGVLGYEDKGNFAVTDEVFNPFYEDMIKELYRNSKSPFVINFRENYVGGKVPFYALIELFSFGTLSKFFKNMKNEDKKAITAIYGVSYTYFQSWIENIAFVRNICAHYGRLYNAKFTKAPRLYKRYTEKGIRNYRLFATLITLKHLLPNDKQWLDFVDTVELLIEKYPSVKLYLIDFPQNWKDYLT
jgi:abortive infection bacteriophage resistance protein